jgi:uncharacterized protein YfbU (UPF0304 family)
MKLGDGEKLILIMLSDIYEKIGINGEINPGFVREVVLSGHTWALHWKYPGVFEDQNSGDPPEVSQVVDILDMWSMIEDSFNDLPAADQALVKKAATRNWQFLGFDGNHETQHMSIARFFVEHLDRFTEFKGRSLNSHIKSVPGYMLMLPIFESIRSGLHGRTLNAEELIQILNA